MTRKNIYLLLLILIASFTLIAINFYTIKTLSAVRAYINGESEYSKGQKDALLYLSAYIDTREPAYLNLFTASIQVPIGDNLARRNLKNHASDAIISSYFFMGRNHPQDIPDMIWLFKTFRSSFMEKPIRIWTEAEPLINQLSDIGSEIHLKIENGSLTEQEKQMAVKKISSISADLYKKESEFSQVLGDTARKINGYLLLANFFCILLIIGSIELFAMLMIARLNASNRKIEANNKELSETNKELDTFVYSISHDLRAPINSIKGLINITGESNDVACIKEYVSIIGDVVNKQDIFIVEVLDFFKSKRTSLSFKEFSLKTLIDDIIASNKYAPAAQGITFNRVIYLDIVDTDELRLKIILNNLVSNAIKYSDLLKPHRSILIKTQKIQNVIVIEVEDNGVGIDKKYLDKIFNIFFAAPNATLGTGLGLYIHLTSYK